MEASAFPATAALRHGDAGVTCTGTLVAPEWVLTAAHCVANIGSPDPSKWTVFFGSGDMTNNEAAATRFAVATIHQHPDWKADKIRVGFGDVALMKLQRPVTGIEPIRLHKTPIPPDTTLILVGFGRSMRTATSPDQLSGFLRTGENTSITCSGVPFDNANRPEILDTRSICFDTAAAPSPCERDSGGPAYVRIGDKLEVAGITSGGRLDGGDCGLFGIYSSVPHELGFIESIIGKNAPTGGPATPTSPSPGTTSESTPPAPPAGQANTSSGCAVNRHRSSRLPWEALVTAAALIASRRRQRERGAHA